MVKPEVKPEVQEEAQKVEDKVRDEKPKKEEKVKKDKKDKKKKKSKAEKVQGSTDDNCAQIKVLIDFVAKFLFKIFRTSGPNDVHFIVVIHNADVMFPMSPV